MNHGTVRSVVVTGGAGFIGSTFARLLLTLGYERVRVFDKLTYAGNLANVADLVSAPGFSFVEGDICNPEDVDKAIAGFEAIVNFAAETHVDRSLLDSGGFIRTDVHGVWVLLEGVRRHGLTRMVHVSTDEVYGVRDSGSFCEDDPLNPRNPYSASKAGGEMMVKAYAATYGVPAVISRGSNTYGPYQYPEKFISLATTNVLLGEPIPVYGDGRQVRDWIHAQDHAAGIEVLLRHGQPGEAYNLGGGNERENIRIAEIILDELDAPSELLHFVTDRQGHDRRYSLDSSKARSLGWQPEVDFESGLRETIRWYRDNRAWWEQLRSDEFDEYYQANYAARQRLG
ncbi:MAG TPA: dTDP-glucose 4,6-dehydratase [Thermomicrobiales bacterium]|nr:dTDP-glucose 4,6-dehydratase [Chloroflexota bacterium]HQZ89605.1 dTDP-glucose 4,6-dehydratase [Thermomicrobiales bacterium]